MEEQVHRLAQAGQSALGGLKSAAGTAGFGAQAPSLPALVGNFVNAVLGLSGLVLVVLLVYGGILYLTAAGNEEQVKKAKSVLRNAVIGLVIIVSAYAVSVFVVGQLTSVVGGTAGAGSSEIPLPTCTLEMVELGVSCKPL